MNSSVDSDGAELRVICAPRPRKIRSRDAAREPARLVNSQPDSRRSNRGFDVAPRNVASRPRRACRISHRRRGFPRSVGRPRGLRDGARTFIANNGVPETRCWRHGFYLARSRAAPRVARISIPRAAQTSRGTRAGETGELRPLGPNARSAAGAPRTYAAAPPPRKSPAPPVASERFMRTVR